MTHHSGRKRINRALGLAATAALALGSTFLAVPALAESGSPVTDPSVSVPAAGAPPAAGAAPAGAAQAPGGSAPAISDAGLTEAVLRDLGMTLEQFNAAGDQGKRVADAVASLRSLPGYVGISLKDGRIVVEGAGPELGARVAELNAAGPRKAGGAGEFVLVAPATIPAAATAAATAGPSAAPSATPTATVAGAPPEAEEPERVAASTDQLFKDYVREVGAAGLQAVAYANGSFVIRTGGTNQPEAGGARATVSETPAGGARPTVSETPAGGASGSPASASPSEFVARYSNVRLEHGKPLAPEEDFFGGEGYFFNNGVICSAGYGAYSPAGEPLVLTAGHCTEDGTLSTANVERPDSPSENLLGTLGFSQFGGPGNSWITGDELNPGNVGTDIAVIQDIRPGLELQPAASRWDAPSDPGATAVKIIGATSPSVGQPVCRSGRSARWSCGTVDEVGIYVVGGITADAADLRAFRGFLSYSVQSSGGDSGGPWISGNFAVGTHSAGDAVVPGEPVNNFAVATTLEDALTRLPGVQLQLFLNKPALTSPANGGGVAVGRSITGQVPAAPASAVAAGSAVRITVPGQDPVDVPVDATGQWQFTAPSQTGRLQFAAETINGFSRSGASSFDVTVLPSELPAPAIASPGEGASLTALERIEGTGTPGATVELSGGATGQGVVGLDGKWAVPVTGNAAYGTFAVRAIQTAPGVADSPAAIRSFTVVPPAPSVTGIQNGQHFAHDAVPQRISGSALNGATVSVTLDDVEAAQAASDGSWNSPLPAGLGAGTHTAVASQTVDGATSAPVTVTFVIDPAPVLVAAAVTSPRSSGQLPATGADGLLTAAGFGAGVLLVGAIALLLVRRRSRR
ncbi:trypsin-like serine protease [Arthrobacter sp. ISL-72]|uniref:trypsin-like serine protease n=1 Tax=Arthrobacter sp. ISL-72 TaxID=2819114 RepID=UPI001BECB53E|nr:trypsin-like serine protease [Arthrobacter sp. ISL-72]MBT2596562.1 trypsin-like serine protease [Arthrobacter sp. ISL-72]